MTDKELKITSGPTLTEFIRHFTKGTQATFTVNTTPSTLLISITELRRAEACGSSNWFFKGRIQKRSGEGEVKGFFSTTNSNGWVSI
ncbi:MAG: hypothetical protein HQ402_03545 [Parcubacteria group bacterium]|nr:hypothetical protein [Parcubacteria group bacterium]